MPHAQYAAWVLEQLDPIYVSNTHMNLTIKNKCWIFVGDANRLAAEANSVTVVGWLW